jgi:RpiR family carbohydrate utilization transcriptional regulator
MTETSFQERPSAALRARLAQLPPAERQVADLLLAGGSEAGLGSVGRLAERAGTSPATVVRLARRVGYEGFAALKIALAREAGAGAPFGYPPAGGEGESGWLERILSADAESLRRCARSVDRSAFGAAVAALSAAREILFVGVGGSDALASLAAFRFCALGMRATAVADALSQHVRAGLLVAGDVCVAISHTGESRDTVAAAAEARRGGATTVALTSLAGTPLSLVADHTLVCSEETSVAAQDLFANPVALLSVLGALHAAVALARPATTAPAEAARRIATHQY